MSSDNTINNNIEDEIPHFPLVDDPNDSGSTAKRWCFTQHNYNTRIRYKVGPKEYQMLTYEEILKLFAVHCNWMIFGHEIGKQNETAHLQGGFILKDRKAMKWIKRHTNNELHLEKMKKHPLATWNYCRKEDKDNYYEFGSDWFEINFKNKLKKEKKSNKEKYKNALESAKIDDFDNIDPEILIKNFGNLLKVRDMCFNVSVKANLLIEGPYGNFFPNHFLWLSGDTGTLKSFNSSLICDIIYQQVVKYCKKRNLDKPSQSLYRKSYLKKLTKWWNNYKFEKVVIIEEATKEFCKNYIHHLKIWTDQYAFPAEYKGGEIGFIRPEFIIVTSNFSLDDCFMQEGIDIEKDYPAIKRRFTEVKFKGSKKMLLWPSYKLIEYEYDCKKEAEVYVDEYKKCMTVCSKINDERMGFDFDINNVKDNLDLKASSDMVKSYFEKVSLDIDLDESIKIYQNYCGDNNIEIKSIFFKRKFDSSVANEDVVIVGEKRSNDSVDEIIDNDQNKRLKSNNSEESSSLPDVEPSNNIIKYSSPVDGKEYQYIDGQPGYLNYKDGKFIEKNP